MEFERWIVQGISIVSLLVAGIALILIEVWGLKKIWKLIKRDEEL